MNRYLYFSYYDALNQCIGFNVIPSPIPDPTPIWVSENVVVTAPSVSVLAVVALDTNPPSAEPVWIEFYVMENADG
jgi:hypothetical protein